RRVQNGSCITATRQNWKMPGPRPNHLPRQAIMDSRTDRHNVAEQRTECGLAAAAGSKLPAYKCHDDARPSIEESSPGKQSAPGTDSTAAVNTSIAARLPGCGLRPYPGY